MSPGAAGRDAGLPIVPFVAISAASPITYDDAVGAVGSPEVFVKPANMGSSVGVSKARTADEFETCCRLAFRFDSKILIEQCVASVREIECSVLEDADSGRSRVSTQRWFPRRRFLFLRCEVH